MISLQELFEEFNRRIDKPIEYNHLLTSVLSTITSGNIIWDDGIPYLLDPLRNKELSLTRTVVSSAFYGQNQKSRYLKIHGVTAHGNGFLSPRKGTITALWAKSRNPGAWTIEVKKNDSPTVIAFKNVTAGTGIAGTLDIDFEAGDYLQLYLNGVAVDHPIACFEFAWRRT